MAGTPGDCVVMGVRHLMLDTPPDLVLSGVNRGANLGVETVFSGTVGAAMTALLLGLPAIALSQAFSQREPVRWEGRAPLRPAVLRRLLAAPDWRRTACLNVNFPTPIPPRSARPRHAPGCRAGRAIDVVPASTRAASPTTGCSSAAAPGRTGTTARPPPSPPSASR